MKEINYKDMKFNPFNLIGGEWMLVTIAESYPQRDFHTMYVGKSKGIGQSIWKTIETMHPEIEVWETCTPYFDRRNIRNTSPGCSRRRSA